MKKLLLFGSMTLVSLCTIAQSFSDPKLLPGSEYSYSGSYIIPKELSFDGTNRVIIPSDKEKCTVYTNDFDEVKQINIGSSVEYTPTIVTQKEVVSAQYKDEDYVVSERNYISGATFIFESKPTSDEVIATLKNGGYPDVELYKYNDEDYFIIKKVKSYYYSNKDNHYWYRADEDDNLIVAAKEAGLLVEDRKIYNFSYQDQEILVAFANIPDELYKVNESYYDNEADERVEAYALANCRYSCSIGDDNEYLTINNVNIYISGDGYLHRSLNTYSDDEIVAYLNSFDLSRFISKAKQVETVTTDIKGNKWFVCVQEKAGDLVLNKYGFALIGDMLYVSGFEGKAVITYGDKEEVVYRSAAEKSSTMCVGRFNNFDNTVAEPYPVLLSQTFFNDDAQYEYLTVHTVVKTYLKETFTDGYSVYDYDTKEYINFSGEGKVYTEVVMYDGLNVLSENGTVLASVMFPDNFLSRLSECRFFILGGTKYVEVSGYLNYQYGYGVQQEYATIIYKVNENSGSTSLSPVSAPIRVSVMPTMINENETVTVSLDEESNTDKQVRVIDMHGRVMNKTKIPAGQKSTQVNHLPQGLNMVQVMDGDNNIHVQRVIVK